MSFRQGDNMSNNTFLDKFKGLVERYEYHGGEPGMQQARINTQLEDIAVNTNNPTVVEVAEAKATAREEYLAILFSKKAILRGMDNWCLSWKIITHVAPTNT